MSITSKKKELRRTSKTKSLPASKNIGLAEKLADAEKILKSLTNPELLRK